MAELIVYIVSLIAAPFMFVALAIFSLLYNIAVLLITFEMFISKLYHTTVERRNK